MAAFGILSLAGFTIGYLVWRFLTRLPPGIPNAVGRLPVVGAAQELGEDPIGFLTKHRRKLGDVFSVDVIFFRIVFVLGNTSVSQFLKNKEKDFSFWDALAKAQPLLGPSVRDVAWKEKILTIIPAALRNNDRLVDFGSVIAQITSEHYLEWSKQPSVPLLESVIDMQVSCFIAAFFGIDFLREQGEELKKNMLMYDILSSNPALRLLPYRLCSSGRRCIKTFKNMDDIITNEIQKRLTNSEKYAGKTDYLQQVLTMVNGKHLEHIPAHMFAMVLAGKANTVGTFIWTFLHIKCRPELLEPYLEELSSVRPDSNGLYPFDEMPFGHACMRETNRMYTNLMSMARICKKSIAIRDTMGNKLELPAGTMTIASPLVTSRDEEIFPDPHHYDPFRFLDTKSIDVLYRDFKINTFGAGPHKCLGEKLAQIVLRGINWPVLFANYDVDIVSGLQEGKGTDGVGVESQWMKYNNGTPMYDDLKYNVQISVTRKK